MDSRFPKSMIPLLTLATTHRANNLQGIVLVEDDTLELCLLKDNSVVSYCHILRVDSVGFKKG